MWRWLARVALPRLDYIFHCVASALCWNHSLNSSEFHISFVCQTNSSREAFFFILATSRFTHTKQRFIQSHWTDLAFALERPSYRRPTNATSACSGSFQSYHPLVSTWHSLFSSKANRVQTTWTATVNKYIGRTETDGRDRLGDIKTSTFPSRCPSLSHRLH